MVLLYILLGFAFLGVAIYLVEPFLYGLLFSRIMALFVKNPPFLDVEEHFPESRLLRENCKVIRGEL